MSSQREFYSDLFPGDSLITKIELCLWQIDGHILYLKINDLVYILSRTDNLRIANFMLLTKEGVGDFSRRTDDCYLDWFEKI